VVGSINEAQGILSGERNRPAAVPGQAAVLKLTNKEVRHRTARVHRDGPAVTVPVERSYLALRCYRDTVRNMSARAFTAQAHCTGMLCSLT
jgi:hypothetical protein